MNEPTRSNNTEAKPFEQLEWNIPTIAYDGNGHELKIFEYRTKLTQETRTHSSPKWHTRAISFLAKSEQKFNMKFGWFFTNGNK